MKHIPDIIIAILLIWGAWKGFKNGFIIEVFSLLALILGIAGGFKYTHIASEYLSNLFDIESVYLPFLAFVLTFLLIVILVYFLAKLLTKLLKLSALGIFNKLSGLCFGILKYSFLISTFFWLCNQINILYPDLKAYSYIIPFIEPIAPQTLETISIIIPGFENLIQSIDKLFYDLSDKQNLLTFLAS